MTPLEQFSADWGEIRTDLKAFQDKWGKPDTNMIAFIQNERDGYFVLSVAAEESFINEGGKPPEKWTKYRIMDKITSIEGKIP